MGEITEALAPDWLPADCLVEYRRLLATCYPGALSTDAMDLLALGTLAKVRWTDVMRRLEEYEKTERAFRPELTIAMALMEVQTACCNGLNEIGASSPTRGH